MISVSYTNNIERHEPRIIDEYTTTPTQFEGQAGVRLGN